MTTTPHAAPVPPTLIAMGGNSLLDPKLPPTVENQFAVTARAVIPVAGLIARGVHVVLTHGNGPQVGFMQLRVELSKQRRFGDEPDGLRLAGLLKGVAVGQRLAVPLQRRGRAAEGDFDFRAGVDLRRAGDELHRAQGECVNEQVAQCDLGARHEDQRRHGQDEPAQR